jgi:hypothetical protein
VRSPSEDQGTRRGKARPVIKYKWVEQYLLTREIFTKREEKQSWRVVRKVMVAPVWREGEARNSTEKNIILRRKQDDTARVFGAWNESVTTHGVELPQGWRSEEQNHIEQEGEERQRNSSPGAMVGKAEDNYPSRTATADWIRRIGRIRNLSRREVITALV